MKTGPTDTRYLCKNRRAGGRTAGTGKRSGERARIRRDARAEEDAGMLLEGQGGITRARRRRIYRTRDVEGFRSSPVRHSGDVCAPGEFLHRPRDCARSSLSLSVSLRLSLAILFRLNLNCGRPISPAGRYASATLPGKAQLPLINHCFDCERYLTSLSREISPLGSASRVRAFAVLFFAVSRAPDVTIIASWS